MNLLSVNCHFQYQKYKSLFCHTPKKVGSYQRGFTVVPGFRSYPNLAKSVHRLMMYKLSPFSISEYLGMKNSISDEIFERCSKYETNVSAVKRASPLGKFRNIRTMFKYVKVDRPSSLGKVKLENNID